MAHDSVMPVVLCWHMHQPNYRNPVTGIYRFPWTYLHALKDYSDMAAHLEAHPAARAVVNFVPVLLEQIEDYVQQIDDALHQNAPIRDPVLALLANETLPKPGTPAFFEAVNQCLRANQERIINRFPHFARLAEMARFLDKQDGASFYMNEHYLPDLAVWYHLGWLGEYIRRRDARVQRLQARGHGYTLEDRHELLHIILEEMRSIVPRYRRLYERGQVELSISPYAHPMLPLLINMDSAREAMPDIELPHFTRYPGGERRSHWHLKRGLQVFERMFGMRPTGCWSSEGGLSQETLALLDDVGFEWTASGESVLRHSLAHADKAQPPAEHAAKEPLSLQRPYRFGTRGIHCFFRDDGLSDQIGFTFSSWHAKDAVANLIHNLEQIANHARDPGNCVTSIIMDGENAWEYYPENGYHFLDELYRALTEHPRLKLYTYAHLLAERKPNARVLPRLVAGSWVYGTFSTWVGDPDKNKGWQMLYDAKLAYDQVVLSGELDDARLEKASLQLAVCEGSDWFWWFGDYNPAQTVSDFDELYREHLRTLYHLIDRPAPDYLAHSFSKGSGSPQAGGTMRRGQYQESGS